MTELNLTECDVEVRIIPDELRENRIELEVIYLLQRENHQIVTKMYPYNVPALLECPHITEETEVLISYKHRDTVTPIATVRIKDLYFRNNLELN